MQCELALSYLACHAHTQLSPHPSCFPNTNVSHGRQPTAARKAAPPPPGPVAPPLPISPAGIEIELQPVGHGAANLAQHQHWEECGDEGAPAALPLPHQQAIELQRCCASTNVPALKDCDILELSPISLPSNLFFRAATPPDPFAPPPAAGVELQWCFQSTSIRPCRAQNKSITVPLLIDGSDNPPDPSTSAVSGHLACSDAPEGLAVECLECQAATPVAQHLVFGK